MKGKKKNIWNSESQSTKNAVPLFQLPLAGALPDIKLYKSIYVLVFNFIVGTEKLKKMYNGVLREGSIHQAKFP